MKIIFSHKITKSILICLLVGVICLVSKSDATIPNDYAANYEIKSDWDKVLWLFVEIDAATKVGNQVAQSKFAEMYASFQNILPKFPQEYAFQVVYQQCLTLSNALTTYTTSTYQNQLSSFMTNCYKPFSDIITKINSKYTVIANATISPASGPAPLAVTLDARSSTDPSNETIPSGNFFRYYRDANGQDQTIGNSSVVTATFTEAGNYLIHLTVKSSNKITEWILDGEKTISVDVLPKTANIVVYVNGQKLTKDTKLKVGVQEAQKGIIFDGSATLPMGGRQILSYNRTVTSKDWFIFSKDGDGNPSTMRLILPGQGEYKVLLTTTDNEGNSISETYYLLVSDPVAIIKQLPEKWNTSMVFSFDSSPSYSIVSSLKLYTREIFDQDGNKVDTFQGKSIKEQFKKPGAYTVKLTVEDELGQTNIDTLQVFVESTDPIPQFLVTPSNSWTNPSEFIFDASVSSDIDVSNGNDSLSYERSFPETAKATIVNTENNNQKIKVQFDAIGTHTVKLTVKDSYGKISELNKDIKIISTLRPEMFIVPLATPWGNPVNFVIKSNQSVINYLRDFGDGETRTIQEAKATHTYKKASVFKVTLKVTGADGMDNTITKNVFIGEKNYPVAAFTVNDITNNILTQNESCWEATSWSQVFYPAYKIDRYKDFTLDPSLSANTKWEKNWMQFYFQPRNGEIFRQSLFKYKFNELGCNYIDLTAEDTTISKSDKVRVRFKVVNALPKLDNLILFFPQYGNEMGVGFEENTAQDIFNDSFDPLIVKVTAANPIDSDWFISYFKRYYYYKDDPTRPLEPKITPGNIPYTFFSLPRVPGEFIFGVDIYDNDDGTQSNMDIIGNGPEVFFPPDVSRPDIPLVTLRANMTSVVIGDEVTFDVVSKIISGRPDFVQERTIQYDFDGDGVRDLTTKSDRVTHVYTQPSEFGYKPRAAVIYRGYKGIGVGGSVIVKKWLKPMLLSDSFGKLAIFRDVSLGDIANKIICLDLKQCATATTNGWYSLTTGDAFYFVYPSYDKYYISMNVTDKYANQADKKWTLSLSSWLANMWDFHILSIPKVSIASDGTTDFYVGKNLQNSILLYTKYDQWGSCFIDTDISMDADNDGDKTNDRDIQCNQLYLQKYDPKYESVQWRIYYAKWGTMMTSKDFTVHFLDFQANLDADTLAVYNEINQLLNSFTPTTITGTWDMSDFIALLTTLRDGLIDKNDTKSNVVALKEYTTSSTLKLNENQNTLLNDIFTRLTDKSVAAANGGNDYDKAKAEILSLLPGNLAVDVEWLFKEFESISAADPTTNSSQQDQRKTVLQEIIDTIKKNLATVGATVKDTEVDPVDMTSVIMPNICKIVTFYGIVSANCPSDNVKIISDTSGIQTENGTKTSRLRIVLIVVGIVAALFVLLIVIFAIRAKMNQNTEENEEEVTPPPATP